MDLATLTMPKAEAAERLAEYEQQLAIERNPEDEAIAMGYRALARGLPIIRMSETIRAGGFFGPGRPDEGFPRLAVGKADEADCRVYWNSQSELIYFHGDWLNNGHQSRTYAIASIRRDGKRTSIFMHGVIAGSGPDHIDHDGLNNQRSNLRPATGSQNQGNRRPDLRSTSRFKGVSWEPRRRKWRATICGRIIGRYADEVDAARAYDAEALVKWGAFAYLNLPLSEMSDA